MRPIWLDSYPAAVPRALDPRALGSLVQMAARAFETHAERPAYYEGERTLSYGELDRLSRRYSSFLRRRLALAPGERVALMCPNALAFPVALFGHLRAGLVQVNVNPFSRTRELRQQLGDAQVQALVLSESALEAAGSLIDECGIRSLVVIGAGGLTEQPGTPASVGGAEVHTLAAALADESPPLPDEAREAEDLAFLQYTGGTTGRPKGAMLSHLNVLSGLLCFDAFTNPALEGTPRVIVTATPLYHIMGLVLNCMSFMHRGGANVLIRDPRDTRALIAELRRRPFNAITGVNALYNALAREPDFEALDFSSLRIAMGGGTPIQEAVDRRFCAVTGLHIREGYGMSETSGLTQTPFDLDAFKSTVGLPYPGLDFSLRDDAGDEVPLGQPGEVCVRGDSVMQGYWRREAERDSYTTPDGFFRTGDVGRMDEEGYLYIVDRKKDVILVSGFNVYPVEIEEVAMLLPGVRECGCVGSPDERSGEAVNLFVVAEPGAELSADDVRRHCREHLSAYKVPRRVEFIEALPKTPVGKILKRELRALL